MAASLSTPCAQCPHVSNWHRYYVPNLCTLCECGGFVAKREVTITEDREEIRNGMEDSLSQQVANAARVKVEESLSMQDRRRVAQDYADRMGPDIRANDPTMGAEVVREKLAAKGISFVTKDSGERATFDSGMVRDTDEGKARFELLWPKDVPYKDQFMTRVAELLARGAEKYDDRNWEKAQGEVELARFQSSALRHMHQWLAGDTDEDHAAAVVFNLLGAETTKYKMES